MVFYSNCHLSANKGARDHFEAGIRNQAREDGSTHLSQRSPRPSDVQGGIVSRVATPVEIERFSGRGQPELPSSSRMLDCSLDSPGKKSGWAGRAGTVSVTPEVRLIAEPAAATAAPQNHLGSTVKAARLGRSVNPGLDRELDIVQCKFHGYRSSVNVAFFTAGRLPPAST